MSKLIDNLEKRNRQDSRVRAVLRRSLAFEPGEYVPAYPCVEPFLAADTGNWRRRVYYLVAGLWAAHWREGCTGKPLLLARACADLRARSGSASMEARFIALLEADRDQLPHRLRQTTALLKDYAIDFNALLGDLPAWSSPNKPVQQKWAREFYRSVEKSTPESENEREEDVS